ncbi:hypothetical protein WJX81_000978 [Elliptochloris bilobata]|uniref:Fe2OG dioxygenase domain-containing protein n=1 Tax=Elliptochloris bilobata TaxID=381761 RepID=A0AAW1RH53_9CHLO
MLQYLFSQGRHCAPCPPCHNPLDKVAVTSAGQETKTPALKWAYEFGQNLYYVDTCETDQELVRHTRDALPAEEFGALRRGVLGMLEARSRSLAEEGSTRCLYCVHIVLNIAGITKLKTHPEYGFLYPFFARVRLEDANAFDINVAMVYPTTDPGSDAYEAHYDVVFTKYLLDEAPVAGLTVLRRWEYGVMSDVTSVLYLQAPADMRGGNFRVWDPNVHDWSLRNATLQPAPTQQVDIKENTLVQFRGDAMHGFDPFSSETGLPRVSLVVRCYKIATQDYAFTPEFHIPSAGT